MVTYNLTYFLSFMSKSVLLDIVKELALESFMTGEGEEDEQELRAALLQITEDQEIAKQVYQKLSVAELEVLHYFIFHVDEDLFSYRQMERSLGKLKPAPFRLGLTKLRRKGLIFTVRRQWGEIFYALPKDVCAIFYQVFLERENIELLDAGDAVPLRTATSPIPPYDVDVFLLLDYLRIEKGRSIPLTKKGDLPKRYINQWQSLCWDREDGLEQHPMQVEDPYSKQLALLLDFLTQQNIIVWYEEHVELDMERAQDWMEQSRAVRREQFLAYWQESVRPSTSWLRRYQKDLLSMKGEKWSNALGLVENWEEQYSLPGIAEIRQKIIDEVLHPLHSFGLIEWGKTEQGEDSYRHRIEQEIEAKGWLQPTLELFIPSFIPFSSLWRLTLLFSWEHWEEMLVLKLSKQKLNLSLQQGLELEEWLDWLGLFCGATLPEPFLDYVHSLQKELQQATASDVSLIELRDSHVVEALMKWPELKKIDARQLGPHFVCVPLLKKEELISILEKKGIKVLDQREAQDTTSGARQEKRLLSSKPISGASLKVESIFPEMEEAIPEWKLWPELWKKNLSSYHLQTKKEILEKAIQFQIEVRLQQKDGRITEMIPSRCLIEHGQWMCYDQQQKRYDLEDMHKLQMIFPYES